MLQTLKFYSTLLLNDWHMDFEMWIDLLSIFLSDNQYMVNESQLMLQGAAQITLEIAVKHGPSNTIQSYPVITINVNGCGIIASIKLPLLFLL